ncbi:MAG: NfeD family protein [Eubacteriales bacterium]|nr:NfeD family protein [Eubacteriales bacterium]
MRELEVFFFSIPEWSFWLILAVIFFIAEATSINLTTIWFAIGAISALLLSLTGVSFMTQLIVFLLISIASLLFFLLYFKPRLRSKKKTVRVRTNADRILDQRGIVIKEINPLLGSGMIHVNNEDWSAASLENEIIPVGTEVVIKELRGVKAIVAVDKEVENVH